MLQIARLIGAAGSGKTTELLRLMEGALPSVGGDPNAIGLMSFTVAARQEAAERAAASWNVPVESLTRQGWIRTGHSVCYRQLGIAAGQMISDSKADLEWLANVFGVRIQTTLDDESGKQAYIGDERVAWSLNAWALHRVTLKPLDEIVLWMRKADDGNGQDVSEVISVAEKFESAKRLDDRCDFTDLLLRFAGYSCSPKHGISRVTPEGELPPVKVWLFDEQQDASPLLDAVCKRLVSGPDVRWCYVVGDPFQSIYGFAGSSSQCFLAWPAQKQRIMPKSYRCPAPILAMGEECLKRMTPTGGYFDRGVSPADHDGTIEYADDLQDVEISADEDWLLLARTNYQATRLAGYLTSLGVPFRGTKSHTDPTSRMIGMAALWKLENGETISGKEWSRAVELLPSRSASCEMLVRGSKKRWKDEDEQRRWDAIFHEDLKDIGATDHLVSAIGSGDWVKLVDHGLKWRNAAKKWGVERAMMPRVRVGTIHSAKGMEAENVLLWTTTSARVEQSSREEVQYNEECRLAYVGVTRTKRNLHIVTEGGRMTPRMKGLE